MHVYDISVIIPAHNEADWLARCIGALLAQDSSARSVEIIVVANACTDSTVAIARGFVPQIAARGWGTQVLDLAEAGKLNALNAGDRAATGRARLYLDADVTCDPDLLGQLIAALATEEPRYATGALAVAPARSWITRHYARVWTRLPFVQGGAVGAGLFAVNPAGRARWGAFPAIISDDTFVRLHFTPSERIEVPARYHWPMIEGLANLVRVRQRQDAGVEELRQRYPELMRNEGKPPVTIGALHAIATRMPVSFLVYLLVHFAVRLRPRESGWARGR
ncbi:glycosyltransferase family 2 protein [Rhodobacter calidifons]|uniref:Glycosyltransferase family 2 protein n=1 Tax=Rhodobacter calidifons TaxID=2715277 RepID=A0ABX0G835_9RHOB|nr:glycosyltransferase family 2 protein [Rhodobacter calidifons]NHB77055.1 glycosyltransferase family 2 protein [Rhodobacter calidifons]